MKVYRLPVCVIIFGFMVLFYTHEVVGADLYQFIIQETAGMPEGDCRLIERYYNEDKNRISFPGRLDKDGCWVSMSHKEYEDRFAFCYLAGVVQYKTDKSRSAECFVQKTGKEYLFRAHVGKSMWKESHMACYISCIGKEEK